MNIFDYYYETTTIKHKSLHKTFLRFNLFILYSYQYPTKQFRNLPTKSKPIQVQNLPKPYKILQKEHNFIIITEYLSFSSSYLSFYHFIKFNHNITIAQSFVSQSSVSLSRSSVSKPIYHSPKTLNALWRGEADHRGTWTAFFCCIHATSGCLPCLCNV